MPLEREEARGVGWRAGRPRASGRLLRGSRLIRASSRAFQQPAINDRPLKEKAEKETAPQSHPEQQTEKHRPRSHLVQVQGRAWQTSKATAAAVLFALGLGLRSHYLRFLSFLARCRLFCSYAIYSALADGSKSNPPRPRQTPSPPAYLMAMMMRERTKAN